MSTKARKAKRRPSKAIDFTQLNRWYNEVLFTLDGVEFTRKGFAKLGVMNLLAIGRLKNYVKKHKITSFQELWNHDWFEVGGDRTRYVAMKVLQKTYKHQVHRWLEYEPEEK